MPWPIWSCFITVHLIKVYGVPGHQQLWYGFSSTWKVWYQHHKGQNIPLVMKAEYPLQWHHNERIVVSNHQPHGCLLNHLFSCRSKKTSKLRVTGLCAGNSPGTGEFPAQMASNTEKVSIWWRHHAQANFFCSFHRQVITTSSFEYVL